MPPAAQYANASGPRKTMIDDLLDLDDDGYQQERVAKKYIRNSVGPRSYGVDGSHEDYSQPGMGSSMRGGHPRMPPSHMQGPMRMPRQVPVQEEYEEINIQSVANRVFPSTASYIRALDDSENPLNKVAISLLSEGVPNGCDKTIYIIIIIILCIAIACLLYRMSRT